MKALKTVQLYLVVLVICTLHACDGNESQTPNSQATVTVSPVKSLSFHGGDLLAYIGDSVRYSIEVNSPVGISEIRMMEVSTENSLTELSSFPTLKNLQAKTYTFEFRYFVTDTLPKVFFVQPIEINGAILNYYIHTKSTVKFKGRQLKELLQLKLYNSTGSQSNAFMLDRNPQIFTLFDSKQFVGGSSTAFVNPTKFNNPENLSFIKGWQCGIDNGSYFFKSSTLDYNNVTALQIEKMLNLHQAEATSIVSNVSIGDVYIAKIHADKTIMKPDYPEVSYAIIKVIGYSDDLKREIEGGRDDDHIILDIKMASDYRFKQ